MELKVLALMALMAAILAAARFGARGTDVAGRPAPARIRSKADAIG
jgi:hypothetical protein